MVKYAIVQILTVCAKITISAKVKAAELLLIWGTRFMRFAKYLCPELFEKYFSFLVSAYIDERAVTLVREEKDAVNYGP